MNGPGDKIPGGVPAEGSILSKVIETEGVTKAKGRAKELIDEARLNQAIKVIERLEEEVASMVMPERFSRTKKPSESVYRSGRVMGAGFHDLTEDEYKRQQLLVNLIQVKSSILEAVEGLETIVLDIEATKQE
ncbi:hypothetical protein A3A95_03465 [Candidatus Nomurabacteria bacterium RIFCSPLOWO2_01_FULL_39_18]|uniref:Uncharacterized protein n=1 Tax=Candidatus Nomurabacteria bacterium RIFCSPHIGHO2_01_FULL_40_24b TaxID=1801739 RepID=A0A1F6V6A9_9BACT|nr:MAG: hypothetical protein A2647_05055 [Candidatus Nomurabacteria bacterium RIFCSPHIGHO2_01_FULL_40_24b]OGI89167.1 MAG: hypothetical protein A3A95_03465 [Candidatus Nomurabacteria bacterium RIFCSPLOWO2_01_FULL_39_18]